MMPRDGTDPEKYSDTEDDGGASTATGKQHCKLSPVPINNMGAEQRSKAHKLLGPPPPRKPTADICKPELVVYLESAVDNPVNQVPVAL